MKPTILRVEGVASQTKGAVAHVTAEAAAVEEEALGAEPLHHVHPPGAEVADVAAAELLTSHTLKRRGETFNDLKPHLVSVSM